MRKSGILLHISSLPSPWGIGTLGAEAKKFIDFLAASGQSFWQVLPLSPTGYGDSPYQSYSSYAGNPYFIDLDLLSEWGLLEKHDFCGIDWGNDPERVDFRLLFENRFKILRKAVERIDKAENSEFNDFCSSQAHWLDDYALFMALKDSHNGASWDKWERPLRFREESALSAAAFELRSDIEFFKAIQYLFFRQWTNIKNYAAKKGISIIGDLPIYVAPDSVEIWANPGLFLLDGDLKPIEIAGCPPDCYASTGQLWGNPLYNWEEMKKDGYSWWLSRIRRQFELFDVLRIDHFRGFDEFYSIPYGSETAQYGVWKKGPGMELFMALKHELGEKAIIAEDLGFLNESVRKLLNDSGFPGMKVLQFAFESLTDSDYLPHNYPHNCVAYTSTHDNNTTLGWLSSAPEAEKKRAFDYLRVRENEGPVKAAICAIWGSVAELAIVTMQDLLQLGAEARMNTPGTSCGNWQWRMKPQTDLSKPSAWLENISKLYGR